MNIIFQINGGIGKCILATPVCEAIKSQHPNSQLIVMSGYPEVFLNNPFVDRSFAFGQAQYFYQDFIEGKDFKVFAHDPYLQTEYLMQNEHLVQTWTKMFDINTPEDILPKLYITERERIFFSQKFYSDRPILLLQTNGGAQGQDLKYSWARDIPSNVVQSVIEEFKNQYNIVHMRREDQIGYEGTLTISDNFRALAVLIELSSKRLLMDSFGHHAAAALNKPSTVLWIANTPVVFGHDIHDNIVANPLTKKPELKHSYIQKFDITGNLLEFPYNSESEIFDVDKVIASIKNQN
jgi:ADP-heptose:LPS heptosyltransferase